ncbi:MAG: hypothetical protein NZ951_03360 [Dehalococcoidia bacterium]|nr:hypothetical protein [Dehalococcoidia bacterium]MDW8119381.1 hypothetical protein [Chloroflexota bacterium]
MRVFFDVDLTILYADGSQWALRPGTEEVFRRLRDLGCEIYVWTATGRPHAERVVHTFGLARWVTACLDKDADCPIRPDMVVDDDDFLVQKYSGVWVKPYRHLDPHDRELYRVIEWVEQVLRNRARPLA